MDRELIREKTMHMVYQMEANGEFDYSRLTPVEEDAGALTKKQAVLTLEALRDHIISIDDMISRNLDNWAIDRIAKTDLAILRTAVTEMMYIDTIPCSVSINEAVKMSKKFSDEKSYAFVNSVLSKVAKCLEDK